MSFDRIGVEMLSAARGVVDRVNNALHRSKQSTLLHASPTSALSIVPSSPLDSTCKEGREATPHASTPSLTPAQSPTAFVNVFSAPELGVCEIPQNGVDSFPSASDIRLPILAQQLHASLPSSPHASFVVPSPQSLSSTASLAIIEGVFGPGVEGYEEATAALQQMKSSARMIQGMRSSTELNNRKWHINSDPLGSTIPEKRNSASENRSTFVAKKNSGEDAAGERLKELQEQFRKSEQERALGQWSPPERDAGLKGIEPNPLLRHGTRMGAALDFRLCQSLDNFELDSNSRVGTEEPATEATKRRKSSVRRQSIRGHKHRNVSLPTSVHVPLQGDENMDMNMNTNTIEDQNNCTHPTKKVPYKPLGSPRSSMIKHAHRRTVKADSISETAPVGETLGSADVGETLGGAAVGETLLAVSSVLSNNEGALTCVKTERSVEESLNVEGKSYMGTAGPTPPAVRETLAVSSNTAIQTRVGTESTGKILQAEDNTAANGETLTITK